MQTTCTQHPWTAPDGAVFSYSKWDSEQPRAVMVAIHGLSGAALDYEPLGTRLHSLGFVTYAPELRGQGNDPLPARRGDLDRMETWFTDLRAFIAQVRAQHPGLPFFLYGESMGGAILTRYLAQASAAEQPVGLILASPVIALQQHPPLWINVIFRTLLLVAPRFRIDVRKFAKKGEAPKLVTRDEAHREWIRTAPHKLEVFTVRFFKNLQGLIAGCSDAATQLHMPVLIVYAQHDIFIPPNLIEPFFDHLASTDKERTLYPESYHLLLHDHDREQVLERVTTWLEKHTPDSTSP